MNKSTLAAASGNNIGRSFAKMDNQTSHYFLSKNVIFVEIMSFQID